MEFLSRGEVPGSGEFFGACSRGGGLRRREFLNLAGRFLSGACLFTLGQGLPLLSAAGASPAGNTANDLYEAMFYEKLEGNRVRCQLCFRGCELSHRGRGYCRVRGNLDGKLYSLVYGKMAAVTTGPVEKKPLFHYRPGARAYNLGTAGCNLRCRFCHNWHLSQKPPEEVGRYEELTPKEAVGEAQARRAQVVSFTYNEPTVFYEFMLETARLAHGEGLGVNVNTNAMLQKEPLQALLEYADSCTVDLKGFSEDFYREVCAGRLEPVLRNLELMREKNVWVEVVNPVIPGLNDQAEVIKRMCGWIYKKLGPEVPLHFNRFFPSYKLTNVEPTPVEVLEEARDIAAEEGLKYIIIGNVPGHPNNSTYCPGCEETLIERHHFSLGEINIEEGKCTSCGLQIPGVW